ncbi:DinB family protein [Neolewinella persica]|uniref:DinB family protein n=1 Tax=Neolewinella persica TaxID=70998 RepID=UPI000382CBAD|nr:DinB family protein [Neolewinella persica]
MLPLLKSTSIHFLNWNLERIGRCLDELTEEQVWLRPNGSSNSVGNQVLHLCGNISQWMLTGLGDAPDHRERDMEFAAAGGFSKEQLSARLTGAIAESITVITGLKEEDITRIRPVQAYQHDGLFILIHVVEHLSYHTGQIIFWTKALKDVDLDLYGGDALDSTT